MSVKETNLEIREFVQLLNKTFLENHHLSQHHSHQDISAHRNNIISKIYGEALNPGKSATLYSPGKRN